jgi:glycosyltransferase involved in cell wall biosynthesis
VTHPVSVQICTLDEEANIAACLETVLRNDAEDVVVVDGGSRDATVDIARGMGVRVIEAGRIGLARQRRAGFESSASRYTAFVDADDRLADDWLATMVRELEAGGYSALQSCLRVPPSDSWWARSWDQYFVETIRPTADTIMVGRPALFRTDDLMGIRTRGGMLIEDTEMSKDFQDRGLRQGIGTAVAYRLCPTSASENLAKWRGYGRGYRQFVAEHPARTNAILRHMFVTVPLARTWRPVLRGHVGQPLFGLCMAGGFAAGYWASAD